jgi:hypothetical protein
MYSLIDKIIYKFRHLNCKIDLCYENDATKELFIFSIVFIYFFALFVYENLILKKRYKYS